MKVRKRDIDTKIDRERERGREREREKERARDREKKRPSLVTNRLLLNWIRDDLSYTLR